LARSTATVVGVLVLYFVIPIGGEVGAWTLAAASLGALAGLIALFAHQLRSIRQASYPTLRAVEGLVSIAVLYVVTTSAIHVAASAHDPQAYSEPLSRLDSIYFTVTMLTTVGFGDITPVSAYARGFATLQMVLGVALVTGVVKVLMSVASSEKEKRQTPKP
jgi:hypothetical protein